jgi:hypothetical protein
MAAVLVVTQVSQAAMVVALLEVAVLEATQVTVAVGVLVLRLQV